MNTLKRVGKTDIFQLYQVALILNACGKDMAERYDLHHWDNCLLKSLTIVALCNFENDIFLLYDDNKPIATFMTKRCEDALHFEKLGTLPSKSGNGVGSYCMNKIEKMAKNAGCKRVVMEVYEPSKHAILFYEHKGYKAVGMTETLKYKEVKMEKRL